MEKDKVSTCKTRHLKKKRKKMLKSSRASKEKQKERKLNGETIEQLFCFHDSFKNFMINVTKSLELLTKLHADLLS